MATTTPNIPDTTGLDIDHLLRDIDNEVTGATDEDAAHCVISTLAAEVRRLPTGVGGAADRG